MRNNFYFVISCTMFENFDYTALLETVTTLVTKYALLFLLAGIVFFLGFKGIKIIDNLLKKAMRKAKIEKGLQIFTHNTINILLKVILVIIVANILGVATSSFVAILGAAGLAIGLSLQGSLANFAGGVIILLLKPFKIGEYIEAQGVSGTVEEINIYSTIISTVQGQMVSIPNGQLANGTITNYTRNKIRRMDISVGIAYEADIQKARKALLPLIIKNKVFLKDPAPQILVDELADSSVNLIVRGFLPTEEYWNNYYILREQIKTTLDEVGISIPFPQRVVHLIKE